jgi:single-stranded DNA-binding protein
VECQAWGKTGELINQYMSKGRPLFVEGRLTFSSWEGKDGQKKSKLRVTVENFQFLGGGGQGGGQGGGRGGFERQPRPYPYEVCSYCKVEGHRWTDCQWRTKLSQPRQWESMKMYFRTNVPIPDGLDEHLRAELKQTKEEYYKPGKWPATLNHVGTMPGVRFSPTTVRKQPQNTLPTVTDDQATETANPGDVYRPEEPNYDKWPFQPGPEEPSLNLLMTPFVKHEAEMISDTDRVPLFRVAPQEKTPDCSLMSLAEPVHWKQ